MLRVRTLNWEEKGVVGQDEELAGAMATFLVETWESQKT